MRYAFAALLAIPAVLSAQTPDAATLAGLRWRSIGPVNMAGRITDVEVDPRNPKVFYVAGATGGIWKTVNAGTTWVPLWERQPIASLGQWPAQYGIAGNPVPEGYGAQLVYPLVRSNDNEARGN